MPPIRAALPGLTLLLAALAPASSAVQDGPLTGRLHVVWADPRGREPAPEPRLFLVDDRGRAVRLRVGDAPLRAAGGALRLNGRRVVVRGSAARGAGASPTLDVASLEPVPGPDAGAALDASADAQALPYAVLLCRFADRPADDPRPRSDYERWMGAAEPGLDHYWRELSDGRVGMAGSRVFGPYVLPNGHAHYFPAGEIDFQRLVQDCTGAADAEVDFSGFRGVAMQFNRDLEGYSWGGSWTLALDGAARRVGMMWMAEWATQHTYAHEVGHTLGLPHSSGPYANVYDSRWDVMSGGQGFDPAAQTQVAVHTIGWHKEISGWLDPARVRDLAGAEVDTVLLTRSARPGATGLRMVRASAGGGVFYTVEARLFAGYDGRLPAEAVVLHRVDPLARQSPARVVDVDANGNPNDDGARWLVGETFSDAAAGVTVHVLRKALDGFEVVVSTGGRMTVVSEPNRPPAVMGAEYRDRLEATGGSGRVAWSVSGGSLPEGLELDTATGEISGVPARHGNFSFTVQVVSATGSGSRLLQIRVTRPELELETVADHLLLGASPLTADELRFLDLLGNRDGRLDVGDVRAWLDDSRLLPSPRAATGGAERP